MAINISILNLVKDVTGDTREEEAVEKLRSSLEQEFNNFPNGSRDSNRGLQRIKCATPNGFECDAEYTL